MSVIVRSLIRALALLAASLAAALPASAATIQVTMTGTWTSVVDTAGVLDGSIAAGGAFTATFTYDDQVPDGDPFVGFGTYLMNGSVGTLAFTTGNYAFVDQGTTQNGVGTEDSVQGVDIVALFFDRYAVSGPLPTGVGLTSLAYANPSFYDYTESALVSDRLTDIPWDVSLWDANFYFFGPVTNRGAQDYIELDGAITGLAVSVVPEPSLAWLLAAGAIGLAWRRRSTG